MGNKKNILILLSLWLFSTIACIHVSKSNLNSKKQLELFILENPPIWGRTELGQNIYAGGFSGLIYIGKNPINEELQFYANVDRGPNTEPVSNLILGTEVRPFVLPDFQLRWLKLETDHKSMTLKITDEILLTDPKGKPIRGVPQWQSKSDLWADEKSINLKGESISTDLMGMDPESLAIDADGNFWIGEEYRPSILKFSARGQLLKRFIPLNSLPGDLIKEINVKYGSEVIIANLPEDYKYRKVNRGFEGLTFLNNKIYGMLQSPLEIPNAVHEKIIRILEFDVKKEIVTNEFYYPLLFKGVDKIGDLSVNPLTSEFFAILQNSKIGEKGQHLITSFSLNSHLEINGPELKSLDFLKSKNALLSIENQMDLSKSGYGFAEKVEGIALLPDNQIAVINDNDFGVGGNTFDSKNKTITLNKGSKTILGIISLK